VRVFAFEEPQVVYACESVAAAEVYFEAIAVGDDEYEFFGDDGTVITGSVRNDRVVLTPTSEKRPEELRERLRTYLMHPQVAMDPALADDPAALADLLIELEQGRRWPRWPAWLRFGRSG